MRVTATHELLAADILARCDASSDVRVVNNKLLGGWYVVRGTSDTPISGKFPSKEAAQQWLIDRKNARNDAAADVVVDSSGKVVQLSGRAKSAGIRMGEKLSSTQLDDLSESGLSVREQK